MNKKEKDKQLINECIEHWDRLILLQIEEDNEEQPNASHCPLCAQYYEYGCKLCPIYMKTGEIECIGTPFHEAKDIWISFDPDHNEAWQQAATKMKDWLKDLYEDYNNTST